MSNLIEPDDDVGRHDAVEEELRVKGVHPEVAPKLAEWALRDDPVLWWPRRAVENPLPDDRRIAEFIEVCGDAFRTASSPRTAAAALLQRLVLQGAILDRGGRPVRGGDRAPHGLEVEAAVLQVVLPDLRGLGLDVRHAAALTDQEPRLLALLFGEPSLYDSLRPGDFLDLPGLRAWNPIANRSNTDIKGPGHVAFWLQARGGVALAQLLEVVKAEPTVTVGRVAGAVLQEVTYPVGNHAGPALVDGPDAIAALYGWCDHLLGRAEETECRDGFILAVAFEATALLEQVPEGSVPGALAIRAGEVGARALGALRRQAREGLPTRDLPAAHRARSAYGSALVAIARAKGVGQMLCHGIQLLRALREPAVPADLRWWAEDPLEPPPLAWGWLPMAMASLIHSRGRSEQERDPQLEAARIALADFLAERLKPRKRSEGTQQLTEPDAVWRQCCIRAAQELGVNPEGRAHRILFNVEQHDPDEDVRRLAHAARHDLRRAEPGEDDISPRRRLMAALWWLRQAHRLSLGLDVDTAGARRTRQREISMATDPRTSPG